jgi:hypothetical protein
MPADSFSEKLADFAKKFESVNQTVITKKQFDEILDHIVSMENDLPERIFAKAIAMLLDNKDHTGIAVEIPDEGQFLVALKDHEVTIERSKMDCPDRARFTMHDTKEDAITAAALDPKGHYVEDENDKDEESSE